jgi:DNA-binding NtrC family response regulator
MTSIGVQRLAIPHHRPAIAVVDDDEGSRNVLATSIRRRYANDYELVGASGPEAGRAARGRLHSAAVAIIAARQSIGSEDGTTCPSAARPATAVVIVALLTPRGESATASAAVRQ